MGLFSKKVKPSQNAYAVVTGAGSGIGRSFAIVKLLYYSYKIRKKLEITHRLSRSTILYAYV